MTKTERNRYLMLKAVQTVLKEYSAALQTIPAYLRFCEKLDKQIAVIDQYETEYKTVAKGTTAAKNSDRDKLEDELDTLSGCISSYADESGDLHIGAVVMNEREIGKLRDSALTEKAKEVKQILDEQATALKDYGITPESSVAFGQLILNYEKSLETKGSKTNSSVVARGNLKEAFAAADKILTNNIDNIIKQCSKQNPKFYNLYQQARIVKDLGIRHLDTTEPPAAKETTLATASA